MRAVVLLACAACAAAPAPIADVRFANAPPVRAVNDRRDVPKPPAEIEFVRWLYNFDVQFHRRITRALELDRDRRALGVNALDEVPNSTWFTNRIGAGAISPEELAAAPGGVGSPEGHLPWTIVSTKAGGASVGFVIRDARGKKFLMKFDPRGVPEGETATQVIMSKLLWGFGFNVTEDYVVYIDKQDLVLGDKAVIKDEFGNKRPLTLAEVDKRLAVIEQSPNGKLRVMVSAWLDGKPLGGHPFEGVRADDPNDRIPHQLRRDLRGAYALFSWLDHSDLHLGNVLDAWVEDANDAKRHYVKHYWVDYGIGLGFGARKNREPRYGYEFYVDYASIGTSLLSLGIAERPWEARLEAKLRGVGMYETKLYDPGSWVSSTPAYVPIYVADRFDKFWASKIIMRFTREHIRTAVDAGRLTDPLAAAWLTEALIERQRKTARYWFERVNPLDEFTLDAHTLCFKDLSVVYAFASARTTYYTVDSFDRAAHALSSRKHAAGTSGVTCIPLELARAGDGYTILRIETTRPLFHGSTDVHVARDPRTNQPRVIGIWRP
jgi:hypothetical protein